MNASRNASNATTRKGFTLPEVLVSITLLAVLAAVVVPTIASQLKKADPTRLGSDFIAIRGGAEQFLTDVRRYPKSIAQLTAPIVTTASNGPLIGPATYGAADSTRWRGPYLNKDGTATLTSGWGLSVNSAFAYDSLTTTGTSSCTGTSCGQKYMILAVPMTANDSSGVADFDRQFDDGNTTTGVIRYRVTSGNKDTLKFLIMPIY